MRAVLFGLISVFVSFSAQADPYTLAYENGERSIYFDQTFTGFGEDITFVEASCYYDLETEEEQFLGYVVSVAWSEDSTNQNIPEVMNFGDRRTELAILGNVITQMLEEAGMPCPR